MTLDLEKKVSSAIRLLRLTCKPDEVVEVAYSGGKDSDVILELAKMAGINYRAIYRNTTLDPIGTIRHVRDMNVEVLMPKRSFLKIVENKGIPSRFARFCCSELKEYKILDKAILGVRREESTKRAKRYKEPTECRYYNKKDYVQHIYPILDWTTKDVEEFINERHIKCAPVYYDQKGEFHAERRLGCMGCPLKADKGKAELKANTRLFKAIVKAYKKYWTHRPHTKAHKIFETPYDAIVYTYFFNRLSKFYEFKYTMFGKEDCKDFLENYFNVKL